MFAAAREAAGTAVLDVPGATVGEVIEAAVRRFGPGFAAVLATASVWCNGEPAQPADTVVDDDEVAVLPPVSGGAASDATPATPQSRPLVLPRGRLGAAWTITAFVAAVPGSLWLAGWLGVTATAAAAQAVRQPDGSIRQADAVVAIGLTATVVAGSVFGPWVLLEVLAALAIVIGFQLALEASRTGRHAAPRRDVGRPVVVGALCGLAAAGPVVARHSGLAEALAILGLVAAYDVGSYVVGTGAVNRWEGPAAGVASVAAATLAVAALCVPPFRLGGTAVLGLIVALGGPCGAQVARRLADHPIQEITEVLPPAPILYRVSTLLVAGPLVAATLGLLTA